MSYACTITIRQAPHQAKLPYYDLLRQFEGASVFHIKPEGGSFGIPALNDAIGERHKAVKMLASLPHPVTTEYIPVRFDIPGFLTGDETENPEVPYRNYIIDTTAYKFS